VMETGYDLIFKWIPRMVIFGLYLAKKVPFKTVYFHGLVKDAEGKKMSKSKGNVVSPLELTRTYGTDALRMALVVGNSPGSDITLSEEKIRGYRNFATKIWNVARFVLINKPADLRGQHADKRGNNQRQSASGQRQSALRPEDKKNLAELAKIKTRVTKHIEKFEFHLAAETLYHYFWHTFADKIIEAYKPRLQNEKERDAAYDTLETILLECLIMLHPFMPFVTEEIWQKFKSNQMLMVEKW